MNRESLRGILTEISRLMEEQKEYLIELDQQNGDGDLGISMSEGYRAVKEYLDNTQEKDLGRLMQGCGKVFNEAAPSSLGTITAFGFMGMAKALKGREEVDFLEASQAMRKGIENIMEKAGAKPGEKTILDALCPGVEAMIKYAMNPKMAVEEGSRAASDGSEATRQMKSVHGRAAYYGDKSIGILDGGSVVGKLIFVGIRNWYLSK